MNARRVEITLSQERWDALEAARGHEPRASFIKRALDSALAGAGVDREIAGATKDSQLTRVVSSAAERMRNDGTAKYDKQGRQIVPVTKAVRSARELAMERQRKMNERKS